MKKIFIIVILLTVILSFSGCFLTKKVDAFSINDIEIVEKYNGVIYDCSGAIETELSGNYKVALYYGIFDESVEPLISGHLFVNVFNGAGVFQQDFFGYANKENSIGLKVADYFKIENAGSDFRVAGYNKENNLEQTMRYYWSSGKIKTNKNGAYIIVLKYTKNTNDGKEQGYLDVNVVDGVGTFKTYDYGYKLKDPEYNFNIVGHIELNKGGDSIFEVDRFDMTSSSNSYDGVGTVDASKDGSYLVMIKYTKEVGEPDDEVGYIVTEVNDGWGVFHTTDSAYDYIGVEKLEKPEYEFEVVGYQKINRVEDDELDIYDYSIIRQEEDTINIGEDASAKNDMVDTPLDGIGGREYTGLFGFCGSSVIDFDGEQTLIKTDIENNKWTDIYVTENLRDTGSNKLTPGLYEYQFTIFPDDQDPIISYAYINDEKIILDPDDADNCKGELFDLKEGDKITVYYQNCLVFYKVKEE